MGNKARSDNNTFTQVPGKNIDAAELAKQLAAVRTEMKRQADPDDADQDADIGAIAQAEKAAKAGDASKSVGILKTAGKWTLDVAKSVAASLVEDAIEGKFGS